VTEKSGFSVGGRTFLSVIGQDIHRHDRRRETVAPGIFRGQGLTLRIFMQADLLHQNRHEPDFMDRGIPSGDAVAALKWMSEYLTAGGGKNADVIGVHVYNAVPEDDVQAAGLFRALLASHKMDKKPLWNTETGWGFDGKSSDDDVSAYVARAYILNWASGFRRYYWYSWNQTSQLGIRADAQGRFTVLTPAAHAYAQVQKWLTGSKMLSCGMNAKGVWTATLQRPDGTRNRILWSAGAPQSVALSTAWKEKQSQDLTGNVTALGNQKTILVGAAPLLLTTSLKRP
jgi:hypothetical protein